MINGSLLWVILPPSTAGGQGRCGGAKSGPATRPPPNRETQQWNPLKAPDSHGKVLVVTLHEEHQLEHLIVSRPPAALQEEPRIQHASLFHPAGLYN